MMNTRQSTRRTKDIQDPIRFDRSAILMKQHSANGTKKCIEGSGVAGTERLGCKTWTQGYRSGSPQLRDRQEQGILSEWDAGAISEGWAERG